MTSKSDQPLETEKRVLSGYQRKCIEKQLLQLRASLLNTSSLLSPDQVLALLLTL